MLAVFASVLAAGCASSGSKSQASSRPPSGSRPPQAPTPPAVSTSAISSYADLNAFFNKGAAPSADSLGGAFALKIYGQDGARDQVFYVAGANFHAASGPVAFKVVPLGFFPPDQTPDSGTVFSAAEAKAPTVSGAAPTSRGLEFDVAQCAPEAKLPLCRDEWRTASGLTVLHISCWHDAAATGVPAVDLLGYVTGRVYGVSSKPLLEGPAPACAAKMPPPSAASVAGTWRGLYTQKVGGDSCGKARRTVCDPWGLALEQSGSAVTVAEGCCGSSCGKAGWTGRLKGQNLLIKAANASCGGANPVMKVRCSLQGPDSMSCRTSGSACGRCGNDAVSVSGNAILTRSTESLPSPGEGMASCPGTSSSQIAGSWSGSFTTSGGNCLAPSTSMMSIAITQNGSSVSLTESGGPGCTGGTWQGCLSGSTLSANTSYNVNNDTGAQTMTCTLSGDNSMSCSLSGSCPTPTGLCSYTGSGTATLQ